jgi:hypothetical protein
MPMVTGFTSSSRPVAAGWVCRVQKKGKRRDIGLGSTKGDAGAGARGSGQSAQPDRGGAGPGARAGEEAGIPTFREAAALVYAEHHASWKNEARRPVADDADHLCLPAYRRHVGFADRGPACARCAAADLAGQAGNGAARAPAHCDGDRWAVAKGYREHALAMAALNKSLPKAKRKVEHQAALPMIRCPPS